MKKIIIAAFVLLSLAASSAPIDQQTARRAGIQYLISRNIIKSTDSLVLAATYAATPQTDAFFIFNHNGQGFVIVSADTRCTPVLGHSENGIFDASAAPENLLGWLEGCRESIEKGILADAPEDPATAKAWQEMLDGTIPAADAKSNDYLLTSTWSQGYGYNRYCPVWDGDHVVTGCVATAMSQIIRYHRYPTRGFGFKQYAHSVYGTQAVDFDTTEYDYDLMPDEVSWNASSAVIDMVSRLCWHAGITVQMEYQHAGHESGSGALSSRVPEALTYFGYTRAAYHEKFLFTDSAWRAMIREDIDARLPIYYSGSGSGGGHAFVLDGYNNHNEFHFNWGWSGSGDGFYTLTTMQGFSGSQAMVNHIIPSGWDGHLTHFLTSPDGHGDGTSWNNCNSDINAALVLSQLNGKQIWLKEGTYYGDTAAEYAFRINAPVAIYGSFAGTEATIDERETAQHPTILDGMGTHGVLYAVCATRPNAKLILSDLVVQNGYSHKGRCIHLSNNGVRADNITLRQCTSDSGSIAYIQDCRVRYAQIHNNSAPVICDINGAALRQSLIANNDGNALRLSSDARIVACDIVSNAGHGIDYASSRSSVISSLLWNNDTNLRILATPSDTALRYNAIEGDIYIDSAASDSNIADSLTLRLDSQNVPSAQPDRGPHFAQPGERGTAGYSTSNDWQLQEGSACINAGERPVDAKTDGDLNRTLRQRHGRVDIGCYESNYTVGINTVASSGLMLSPNPATASVTVSGTTPGEEVKIYDLQGRLMLSRQAAATCITLDLTSLPAGIYCLRCGASITKVIKK